MTFLKKLFNFYINASIHVAFAVYALVRITELYFDLSYNENLNYFIFFGCISGYNFIKYAGVAKFHHRSLTDNLKVIQVFSLFSFLLMLFYGWQLTLKTVLFFIPFSLLTLLYALPYFNKGLRGISSLKIIIIALVWAGVTVLIPIHDAGLLIETKVILQFIQRFLFVIVLTLPFDIRDLNIDEKKLGTIPQKIGIEKTKKLGFVLLGFSLALEFMITENLAFRNLFLLISVILLFFLMRSKSNQSQYYSSFWVEAVPVFWWVLLVLM